MSAIEWTEKTWNPVVGCTVTSPGCRNCYAMSMAGRLEVMNGTTAAAEHYLGTTEKVKGKSVWTGKIGVAPDRVWEAPLRRRKPTTWFVNSMGDLFHPNVDDALIDRAFAVMALCPQHRFHILTKHPERMRAWFNADRYGVVDKAVHIRLDMSGGMNAAAIEVGTRENLDRGPWPLPNVWLGVSVEDQARADERIPALLDTPAVIRFVSCEPLLGPVDLNAWIGPAIGGSTHTLHGEGFERCDLTGRPIEGLDWVIVGGESGPGARPMHPDWARSLRNQCAAAQEARSATGATGTQGVPFFFKQWGAWLPWEPTDHILIWESQAGGRLSGEIDSDDVIPFDQDEIDPNWWWAFRDNTQWEEPEVWMERIGKAKAGRLLDGVLHDGMPS